MESPVVRPESPMEQEDISYNCVACGEVWTWRDVYTRAITDAL